MNRFELKDLSSLPFLQSALPSSDFSLSSGRQTCFSMSLLFPFPSLLLLSELNFLSIIFRRVDIFYIN